MSALIATMVVGFVLVHLFIGRLRFLDVIPRSRWLSFAGGVAVAYVFLHILPELSAHQETFAAALQIGDRAAETWVYLVALAGLAVFYGLERLAKTSRGRSRERTGENRIGGTVFWLHVTSFGLYNVFIGYLLLHREEPGYWSLLTYFVAMVLHFVTTDFGLWQDHKERYQRTGRWIIAGAVLLGWGIGLLLDLPQVVVGFLFAFLAGGVVLNVLKEELPEERKSRFGPFALGALCFGVLLIAG